MSVPDIIVAVFVLGSSCLWYGICSRRTGCRLGQGNGSRIARSEMEEQPSSFR